MSNWTEERVVVLEGIVGTETPVSQITVAKASEELEVSPRSIGAKLRKIGYEVEKVGARAKTFSEEDEAKLVAFLDKNPGKFTYTEIAANFAGGKFSAKQIQGKTLSLDMTGAVAKAPEPESKKTYTDAEEAKFIELAASGAYLEDIATALNRPLNSVRGKALSLNRTGAIDKIPAQKESHATVKVDPLKALGDISEMTVAEIAKAIDKTERGVKTMITYRQLECADYKAKPKKDAA